MTPKYQPLTTAPCAGEDRSAEIEELHGSVGLSTFNLSTFNLQRTTGVLLGLVLVTLWLLWPRALSMARINQAAIALTQANLQERTEDMSAKAASLGQALQMDGGNAAAWRMLGRIWLSQASYDRAAQALQQAAVRLPGDALTQYNRGISLWKVGEGAQAIQAWHQAAKSDPSLVLRLKGSYERSMAITGLDPRAYNTLISELAQSAVANGGRDVGLYTTIASYYRGLGDLQTAESWYIKGHQEGSGQRWVPAAYLATFLTEQERYDEARVWWERAIMRSGGVRPAYRYNIALTYEAEGKLEQAAQALEKALVNEGEDRRVQYHVKLAELYTQLGRIDQARTEYKLILALDPNRADWVEDQLQDLKDQPY